MLLEKIMHTNNFFNHNCTLRNRVGFHLFNDMSFDAIKIATGIDTKRLQDLGFNQDFFMEKSELIKQTEIVNNFDYFFYKNFQISKESLNYLKKNLENSLLLTYEFQRKPLECLEKTNTDYINFWTHPFKLMDDLLVSIETNNRSIYKKLKKYQVRKEKFRLYGSYWKQRISYSKAFVKMDEDIEDNSLLIIGQREVDKSLEKDGYIYSLNDFQDKIDQYKKQYNKLYYSPHPKMLNEEKEGLWKGLSKGYSRLKKFLYKNPEIEIIEHTAYKLLSSEKIKKVVSISSSVLFEAQFFDKEIEYLLQSLFQLDNDDVNCGISIDNYQLFNPKFWADILEPVCKINKDVPEIKFNNLQNKVRSLDIEIGSLYWGYKNLDTEKKLFDTASDIKKEKKLIKMIMDSL
jgi:hypothetical protein